MDANIKIELVGQKDIEDKIAKATNLLNELNALLKDISKSKIEIIVKQQ